MKNKFIKLFLLSPILISCSSIELKNIDYNEFLVKDFLCDVSETNFDFIDYRSLTLSLAKINYIDNKIYMPSETFWSGSDKMNLKGYDNHVRYIRVNYTILDDFYNKNTNGLTMNVMYYLNKDSYEIYDFNTVFNFFNSLDKIIIYYHSAFFDRTYFYATNNQPEIYITDISNEAPLYYKTFIPVINNKLSMTSLYNFYSTLNIYTKYDNEKLVDGLSIDELKEEAKNIQEKSKDWEFNYCG